MDYATLIGPRVRQLCNAFDQAGNKGAEVFGLTGVQSFILGIIGRHDGIVCAKDFEERLKLRHSTISGILQRLESKDFITAVSDREDRRIKRLALTEKGWATVEQVRGRLDELELRMTEDFTPAEREQFIVFLDRALKNIGSGCHPMAVDPKRRNDKEGSGHAKTTAAMHSGV